MYENIQAIILAAGKSTRFNTGKTKLLEKICGQEMIVYITKLLAQFNIPTIAVVGYQKNDIIQTLTRYHVDAITYITQEEQRGTGHAVMCTQEQWYADDILIVNGDIPLITHEIIRNLYTHHRNSQATISFVTAHLPDINNTSYGRVIQQDNRIKIVESTDLIENMADLCCINAGIYLIKSSFLREHIPTLTQNNAKHELYITDLIHMASDKELVVSTLLASFDHVRGINTFQELWAAEQIKKSEIIKYWMEHGVAFAVPQTTVIDLDVTIGSGSRIGSGVHLTRGSTIGKRCEIQAFSWIENSTIGDNSTIFAHTVMTESTIGTNTEVGPFAHIRNNTHIEDHTIIGNFVEIKNSTIGSYTKAKHLSYLGDATVGSHVNIGAGTITCNHDGTHKHATTIMDHAYIGSNNTLIAPITIGQGAFTAAGSVITHNVPAHALAIARERQINKDGYALKLRALPNTNHTSNTISQETSSFSFICAKRVIHDDTTPEEL